MQNLLAQLVTGQPLTADQARDAFQTVMAGEATDAQIGALLTAIACRESGPTVDEISGAAAAMRAASTKVVAPADTILVDTCGTGGDHAGTFNISTTAAIIAAAAGATLAKHGNRSVTSNSGSSQVLEHLGVRLGTTGDNLTRCLAEARLCFCFAPAHHPAMKHAIGPRKELGFRTLFNLLGPLTNPAGADRQVIGVYAPELTELFAQVLKQLGSAHAMIVHGTTPDGSGGGLDEITITGETRVTTLRDGSITTDTITPADIGINAHDSLDAIKVDSVEASAAMIQNVLAGDPGPARDIACANAAAALVVTDLADSLSAGYEKATATIDSNAAADTLAKLVATTNEA